uniref:histidine kinase n=2 Tax=uncultured Chloroflexota bacterium TaxID=166587 RepID=H5SM27_9CHLR|nr:GAF sensor hybrid histidine kinase [uncultured Chloroflexota bacterium]
MPSAEISREKALENLLREASLLSGASWAVLASREEGSWRILAAHGVQKSLFPSLCALFNQSAMDAWMCGAFSSGAVRSRALPVKGLSPARTLLFPLSEGLSVILVGGTLSSGQRRFWRALAESLVHSPKTLPEGDVSQLEEKLLSDLPDAVAQLFHAFLLQGHARGGWLAIHRAERLEVKYEQNCPQARGKILSPEEHPLIYRLSRSREVIALDPKRPDWARLPFASESEQVQGWIGIPFHAGNRLIAVLVLWRESPFLPAERKALGEQARRLALILEAGLFFEEMSNYLHRLALLNDFTFTISATQSVDQVIRRTFALLERSFKPDRVSLLLTYGELVREYCLQDSRLEMTVSRIAEHPFGPYLSARRRSSIIESPEGEEMRTTLYVHLRQRGQTIGLIVLQSRTPAAFKSHDEQLLGVLSGHLASLIEYSRLREDAEARARRLGLIHDVIEQIIALSDLQEIVQIVADLLVEYFSYEFAQVTLLEEPCYKGLAGKHLDGLAAPEGISLAENLSQEAAEKGESLLLQFPSSGTLPGKKGWQPASAIVVPLRDGLQVIGTLLVISGQPNAFGEIDLVALESLAGILTAVTRNVKQYTSLQQTVQQLRATQSELQRQIEIHQLTERRLIQAAKLAAVGEMAAGIAHELNNPLTTVAGFTELALQDLPKDSPLYPDLELILREARRAREVVRRLLDFSRQGEVTRTRYDFNAIVNDVLSLVRHLLHTSGIRYHLDLEENLPWVYVQVNQMKQVLLNLIHNAIQAMPVGGDLTITTRQHERENRRWVVCCVKDTGIGIPPELQERIFEPFFTTRAQQGGTGLGLSISYNIVADHGGMLEVESQPDAGSCFSIWLPV